MVCCALQSASLFFAWGTYAYSCARKFSASLLLRRRYLCGERLAWILTVTLSWLFDCWRSGSRSYREDLSICGAVPLKPFRDWKSSTGDFYIECTRTITRAVGDVLNVRLKRVIAVVWYHRLGSVTSDVVAIMLGVWRLVRNWVHIGDSLYFHGVWFEILRNICWFMRRNATIMMQVGPSVAKEPKKRIKSEPLYPLLSSNLLRNTIGSKTEREGVMRNAFWKDGISGKRKSRADQSLSGFWA
jgi:hypothetical protein